MKMRVARKITSSNYGKSPSSWKRKPLFTITSKDIAKAKANGALMSKPKGHKLATTEKAFKKVLGKTKF